MVEPVLRIEHLSKRFGDLVAVDDVSLEVEEGEIFALLGPNGAGKTTLIGCLTGLVRPTSGQASILGYDVIRQGSITKRYTGLVPQELNFDPFFTVEQVLAYQMGFFGVRPTAERVDRLLGAMSLRDKAKANTRSLSGGMKRRLLIAKALVHDPKLLFLDEPTAGVDVELREELWHYVRDLRTRGTTVVLTTHYLHEAEELADRVGILRGGRLVEVDPVADLIDRFGTSVVRVSLDRALVEVPDALAALGATLEESGRTVVFARTGAEGEVARLLDALHGLDAVVTDLQTRQSSLEEVARGLMWDSRSRGAGRSTAS